MFEILPSLERASLSPQIRCNGGRKLLTPIFLFPRKELFSLILFIRSLSLSLSLHFFRQHKNTLLPHFLSSPPLSADGQKTAIGYTADFPTGSSSQSRRFEDYLDYRSRKATDERQRPTLGRGRSGSQTSVNCRISSGRWVVVSHL